MHKNTLNSSLQSNLKLKHYSFFVNNLWPKKVEEQEAKFYAKGVKINF